MIAPASESLGRPAIGRQSLLDRAIPASGLLVLMLATMIACADNFADPDLWMHILVGRVILGSGHIPAVDLYSYSAAGLPWRNHEWLAQVILAAAYARLGVLGLKLLKLMAAAVAMCAIAAGLSRTAAPAWVQRVLLLAAAAGITVQMQFRPHLFTLAMLSVVMAALAADVYCRRARQWPLIPCFALWANLHGAFIVGLGALGVAALVLSAQEIWTRGRMARGPRLVAVVVGCAAATLLNPAGIHLWPEVLHSVSDPVTRLFVNDWVSLPTLLVYGWQHEPIQLIPFVLPLMMFAGIAVSLLIAPAPDDLPLAVTAAVFIAAAFESSRNIPLAVIVISIPLAHHWGLALRGRSVRLASAEHTDSAKAVNRPARSSWWEPSCCLQLPVVSFRIGWSPGSQCRAARSTS
jgi:hypothetical protein